MRRFPAGASAAGFATLLFASGLATLPLFVHDTLPRGDDVGEHVQFVQDFSAGLSEGVLFPRWLGHANLGWGSPAFVFYPPLATAVVSILHLSGMGLFSAFRIGALVLTLAAGAAAAALARRLSGPVPPTRGTSKPRLAAAIAGSAFILLPYHAVDLFNRFALAETAAFVFLPLLFLGLEVRTRRAGLLVAIAFAGLCFAHLPTAFLAALIGGIWMACLMPRRLPSLAGGLLLGVGLAAISVLPAVRERPHIHAEWLEENPVYRFDSHYLFSTGTVDVRGDPIHGLVHDEVSLPTLSRVRFAALFTLTVAVLAWGVRRTILRRVSGSADRLHDPLDRYAALAIVSTLGMTSIADPIWRHVPGLASVDFPWRLCIFVTLAAAVLVARTLADLLALAPSLSRPAWGAASALAAILPLSLLCSLGLASTADWSLFTTAHAEEPIVRLRVTGALMPRSNPFMRGFRFRSPPAAPASLRPPSPPGDRVEPLLLENHRRVFEVITATGAVLEVATFDYPGWVVRVDGAAQPHGSDPATGAILVPVPGGRHRVELAFGATSERRAATWISALSLLAAASLTLPVGNRTMRLGRPA